MDKATEFARRHVYVEHIELEFITACINKSENNEIFDISMRSYDSPGIWNLAGLYILDILIYKLPTPRYWLISW